MQFSQKDVDRFWSKVDIKDQDECWLWKASRLGNGYGSFWNGRTLKSNRVAWSIANDTEIPAGMMVLHTCDNKLCCNPSHLYCGDHCNNMSDNVSRQLGTYPGRAKLYAGEIWLVRRLKGRVTSRTVSKMFKVHYGTICDIWKSNRYMCKEGYYA